METNRDKKFRGDNSHSNALTSFSHIITHVHLLFLSIFRHPLKLSIPPTSPNLQDFDELFFFVNKMLVKSLQWFSLRFFFDFEVSGIQMGKILVHIWTKNQTLGPVRASCVVLAYSLHFLILLLPTSKTDNPFSKMMQISLFLSFFDVGREKRD